MSGGAFVDFLLDRYGEDRILQLYFARRSETCEFEFRRLLGEDLSVVETKFWAETRTLAGAR
jgi:hypothetical protein